MNEGGTVRTRDSTHQTGAVLILSEMAWSQYVIVLRARHVVQRYAPSGFNTGAGDYERYQG
ncbi:hypothetical protein GCM10010178_79020 [Lentzea flava]|uniref:Uncharacterized protein n=1 Tax=Lentzea flava TaxID=103732 RepID=A0ABQ2VA95_9PSEU|nr:hypothetical protein GCM10010178_79020 [Lentzea flava]